MNTELQNKVWSILPKEFKEEVKEIFRKCLGVPKYEAITIKPMLLDSLFGHHNLTSDEEEEEMLTCEKYKVEEALNYCDELDSISGSHNMLNWGKQMIAYLFGSKCLLDESDCATCQDKTCKNYDAVNGHCRFIEDCKYEPKPAEPKNEGTRQEQCVPKNAESGTHSFSHILKDDFRDHNRLHIAAMAMQGILSNANRMKKYEYVATKPPCTELAVVVARNALRYADALIAEAEKGGIK